MKFRSLFALFCALALALSALSGCAAQTTTTGSTASSSNAAQQPADDATYVQVQSIDNGVITAVVGTLTQNNPGGQGTAPDQSSGDSAGQPQGTPSADDSASGAQGTAPEQPSGDSASGAQGTPPSGDTANESQGTAPEQPSGDSTSGAQGTPPSGDTANESQGTAPEQPSGGNGGGQGGTMGGTFTAGEETITFTVGSATVITLADGTTGTIDNLAAGDVLAIVLSSDNVAETITIQQVGGTPENMGAGGQQSAPASGSETVSNGTSATTISTDSTISGETYTSSGDDENALRIDGVTATLDGITVNKTAGASSSTENGDFYGMNAGLLALNGATVTITGATVTTNAVNGNGVFSYGSGTTVNISDSIIRTSQNNSGGIQTTGGATMNATNLDVQTEGGSSAAIRSDRGGGDVNVSGGTYVTNGTGSPAVYSTADITVDDAVLTANNSEAIVVEGKNSVTLNNVTLSGNMPASTDENENIHNIMLYQSMSGDAEVGQSSFTATGGSILANAGDMFYVTNTACAITLNNVALTPANDVLLRVCGNTNSRGWGTAGANGGSCVFTVNNQTMSGNILVDAISSLDFSMLSGSVYTGAVNPTGAAGTVNVTIEDGCQWNLTGDCYITSFTGSVANIMTNGYTVYVDGTAITD